MLVNFNEMLPSSRVWIYQANTSLSAPSQKIIVDKLNDFLGNWESHGNPLKASWKLFYDRFLVIAIDETYYPASGCSIDKSVQQIKELEAQLGTDFLGKSTIAVLVENKISTFELKDLKREVLEHRITSKSIVFNNLVPTLEEFENNWQVPAEKTWLTRFFNN